MAKSRLVILLMICLSGIDVSSVYASCGTNIGCASGYIQGNSPIVISMDSYPKVNIVIYAPDFNSSPYAVDTIGEDGSTVTISTREASIPYRLVETGPDTGYFAGYVTLSSTTSVCSPICGPTDGFLAAGGDDGITVSFAYADGRTISATSYNKVAVPVRDAIPEFPFAVPELLAGVLFLVYFSKVHLYNKPGL